MDLFTDDLRRDPYPMYDRMRMASPLVRVPPPFDAWLLFDYRTVKQVLADADTFSSRVPAPRNWFVFHDPPVHTNQRGLISRAFTAKVVTNLKPRIRRLSRQLLDQAAPRGEIDLVADYAAPLSMRVIAEMIGIPPDQWPRFRQWSDVILKLSYTRSGGPVAEQALGDFITVSAEMDDYLTETLATLRANPRDDLLTGLARAQIDGQRLTQQEILGFFQLLLVAGQETTANLIDNAILCLLENPDQLALLRHRPALLPTAIEEVLRYRSPFQWLMRTPTRDVELHGQTIAPGQLILTMLGAANRDPREFAKADRFDITRHPNPHVALGHGIHFCLGAPLARLEASIALPDLLHFLPNLALASTDPWPPRQALHVHGPASLRIRFDAH